MPRSAHFRVWNIVTVPDIRIALQQLDEESIKEKKKQKLMKAGWEARARARREKEKEREEKEAEEKRDEGERENNFEEWASRLRREHEVRQFLTFIPTVI